MNLFVQDPISLILEEFTRNFKDSLMGNLFFHSFVHFRFLLMLYGPYRIILLEAFPIIALCFTHNYMNCINLYGVFIFLFLKAIKLKAKMLNDEFF